MWPTVCVRACVCVCVCVCVCFVYLSYHTTHFLYLGRRAGPANPKGLTRVRAPEKKLLLLSLPRDIDMYVDRYIDRYVCR